MHDTLVRILQLAYFMAPAYCANMAPPFTRMWHGWNRPIHQRWFGASKTVVGFVVGVIAGVFATAAQSSIGTRFLLFDPRYWLPFGLAFGFGAMAGDTAKSFIKRRLGIEPGASWVPFDQLDFAIGALLLVAPAVDLSLADIVAILVMTFVGDIVVNRLAFRFGIKNQPW